MLYFSFFFHLRGLCVDTWAHQKDYNFVLCWGTGVKNIFSMIFFAGSLRNKCYFFTLEDLSSVLL